nr:hypothetical protein [Actinomadura sp. J1-007]
MRVPSASSAVTPPPSWANDASVPVSTRPPSSARRSRRIRSVRHCGTISAAGYGTDAVGSRSSCIRPSHTTASPA